MQCLQNTLIFMYTPAPGTIKDVTVQRVIAEAIGGDCLDFGDGVQNLLVEDIQVRDFLRQGVDLAGNTLAFNHTVRRVTEQSRLQERYFILSCRALRWYTDATLSCPLSSLPLSLVTACDPKGGGKHEGKFYVVTASRQLKLVAADAASMAEWVGK